MRKFSTFSKFKTIRFNLPDHCTISLVLPRRSDDPIVKEYKQGLIPNAYLTELLLLLTNPGERVVDLGAHFGTLSVPAACLGREVLAVDAAELHIKAIEHSAEANRLHNLICRHCAIGEKDGEVAFDNNGLWGRVDPKGGSHSTLVKLRPLNKILKEIGWEHVQLIKLDIEGSEMAAMRSCEDMLRCQDGPSLIYESNGETFELFGYTIREMREYLERLGYQSYRYEAGRLIYCSPEDLQPEMWLDVVALNAKQRFRFEKIIDPSWSQDELVQRCLKWGNLPYDNVKAYLTRELRTRPELLARSETLESLLNSISCT